MDIRTLKEFDRVIIKDEGSHWNNRIGIVQYASHDVVALVTIQNPQNQYIVGIWNANNIELFN